MKEVRNKAELLKVLEMLNSNQHTKFKGHVIQIVAEMGLTFKDIQGLSTMKLVQRYNKLLEKLKIEIVNLIEEYHIIYIYKEEPDENIKNQKG